MNNICICGHKKEEHTIELGYEKQFSGECIICSCKKFQSQNHKLEIGSPEFEKAIQSKGIKEFVKRGREIFTPNTTTFSDEEILKEVLDDIEIFPSTDASVFDLEKGIKKAISLTREKTIEEIKGKIEKRFEELKEIKEKLIENKMRLNQDYLNRNLFEVEWGIQEYKELLKELEMGK